MIGNYFYFPFTIINLNAIIIISKNSCQEAVRSTLCPQSTKIKDFLPLKSLKVPIRLKMRTPTSYRKSRETKYPIIKLTTTKKALT